MTIDNVLSFVNVHRYNGFRRAAEAMFLTQPTLSARIQALERELGAQLLVRARGGGVQLTEAGELFLPYALQIVNAYTQAVTAVSTGRTRLMIGTNISISITMLPHVFRRLHSRHPGLGVELVTNLPGELLKLLRGGECDFLITQSYGLPDLTEIPVYRDRISLVVPRGHPLLSRGTPPDYSQVALENIICSSAMQNYWEVILRHFKSRGVTPNVTLVVDSVEIAKNMVLQGLGVAFLPELALEKELTEGSLAVVNPIPALSVNRDISLIYLPGDTPAYCSDFVAACREYKSWDVRL